jgi:hypothetical protein
MEAIIEMLTNLFVVLAGWFEELIIWLQEIFSTL